MVPEWVSHAFKPPKAERQVSSAKLSAKVSAPKRSSPALTRWGARAVKKSTMMLPFFNWHSGMNRPTAAPVASPTSSKSPGTVLPRNSRPMMLAQVIKVMSDINTPDRMALSLASFSSMVGLYFLYLVNGGNLFASPQAHGSSAC
jgi:hypothetical protein